MTQPDNDSAVLEKVRRDSSRIIAFTALAMAGLLIVVVVGGALGFNRALSGYSHTLNETEKVQQLNSEITQRVKNENAAICSFFRDLGTVELVTTGPAKTGKFGVRLIIDSRKTYQTRGCVPPLPLPSKELVALARQYGIPLN